MIEKYIEDHCDLRQVAVFADNGYSGTNFKRPDFSRMMEEVQAGNINCIIVKDLSRLGRNYIETSQFIEKICPFYGLRFISINDGFDTESIDCSDRLSIALTSIIHDYYAKDISRKVSTALQTKMERGEFIANYAPHGYKKDPENKYYLIVDAESAPVIKQIFEWRSEGMSYMGINKKLNEAGIPSPGQYRFNHGIETHNNKKSRVILWNKHVVTEILNNKVYTGHLAQKKGSKCLYAGIPYHRTDKSEWIVVRNTHEPLISEELFERVQKINVATAQKTKECFGKYDHLPKEKNIFGRKFVCCGCGSVMKLQRSFSTKRDKAYFSFKCPKYAEHGLKGCSDIKMRKSDLDTSVLSFIKLQMCLFLNTENTLDTLLRIESSRIKGESVQQDMRYLQQKLDHKHSLLGNLYVDFKEALLTEKDYVAHKEIVGAEIEEIEDALLEIKNKVSLIEEQQLGVEKWRNMIRRFYESTETSEEMVEAFIEKMILHADGSLDIKLNYMDEFSERMKSYKRIGIEVA